MVRQRAFLKWAGGKFSLAQTINAHLPKAKVLVEPFVGAGSVFMNSNFEHYVLNDINTDLINTYRHLQQHPNEFIDAAAQYFTAQYNLAEQYYALRQQFNDSVDSFERAQLFLYLNRHGYNGLCRYNKKGSYNVPFGKYKQPYFPRSELMAFANKLSRAELRCSSYKDVFANMPNDAVVYCDPPYVPLTKTASFTAYAAQGFDLDDQAMLANLAERCAAQDNTPVLISNHDTVLTRKIYEQAQLTSLQVSRTISQSGNSRKKVAELLALFVR